MAEDSPVSLSRYNKSGNCFSDHSYGISSTDQTGDEAVGELIVGPNARAFIPLFQSL